jgi:hypothetical protein
MADNIRKWLQRLGYSETRSEETETIPLNYYRSR